MKILKYYRTTLDSETRSGENIVTREEQEQKTTMTPAATTITTDTPTSHVPSQARNPKYNPSPQQHEYQNTREYC
jgi:hypothetical protein